MAVYVDNMNFPVKMGKNRTYIFSHLVADTVEELHEMADKIGVQRKWFQSGPTKGADHYDITLSKKALAVKFGAIELDLNTREGKMKIVELNRKYREEWKLNNDDDKI